MAAMVGAGKSATAFIRRWPIWAKRNASVPCRRAISCKSAPAEKKWALPVMMRRAGGLPGEGFKRLGQCEDARAGQAVGAVGGNETQDSRIVRRFRLRMKSLAVSSGLVQQRRE